MDKHRIMVVDDEEDFLNILKLNLEDTGRYSVKTLTTSMGIVGEVNNFKPDLIIMDLLMPALNGIDACVMLGKDSIGKNIPIIVLSALEKEEDKRKAFKAGAIDYIVKPVDIKSLIDSIEKVLAKRIEGDRKRKSKI